MSMIRLTVEETNLLSIYNEGGKRALIENVNAALPYMDADMREACKAHPFQSGRFDRSGICRAFPFTPLMKYERG